MEKLHIRLTEQNLVNDPVGQPYCQLDPQDLPEPLARFVHRRHRAGFLKGVALTSAVGLLAPALVYGVAWAGGGFVKRDQSLGDASPKPIPAVTQEHVTPTPSVIVTPTPTPTFSELVPTPTFSPSVTPTPDQTGLVIKCPTPSGELIKTAPGEGKTVALTFDDGPGGATMAVLRILQEKNVKATFFFTGENAQKYPDDVRAVAEAGNQVGNHTFDHKYPPQVPGGWTLAHLQNQIQLTDDILGDLTGQPICAFRPPGGYTQNVVKAANKELENVYMWSDDSVDWKQRTAVNLEDTADIFRKATDIEQRENPIVLMHTNTSSSEPVRNVPSNRDNTVAALPKIIDWYEGKGFTFVTLDGRTS